MPAGEKIHIGIYGDVNLNVIDGSAIWLQSLVTMLQQDAANRITLLLKAGVERDILTSSLSGLKNVKVLNPIDEGKIKRPELAPREALDVLRDLDTRDPFDILILRGFVLCIEASHLADSPFADRLWCYLTAIPQSVSEMDTATLGDLTRIAKESKYMLCQTEQLRTFLESMVPAAAGKSVLLPPMIPPSAPRERVERKPGSPFRMIYIGKFAPLWNTLEMTEQVATLRSSGMGVELHMVGDKIHQDPGDPGYYSRMLGALESTAGVVWHGAKSRQEVLEMLPEFDLGLSWRSPALDNSLELSTKVLEYAEAGLPVVLNRGDVNESLFGADYPLFVPDPESFRECVRRVSNQGELWLEALKKARTASTQFHFGRVYEMLKPFLQRSCPAPTVSVTRDRPLRLLLATHDFKFVTRVQEYLAALPNIEVRVDQWQELNVHDEKASKKLLEWAEVVFCEWFGENAVWYSQNKRQEQKLVVRLHRFELSTNHPFRASFGSIDRVVFVDESYRSRAQGELGWNPEKLAVIPNWVDADLLARQKQFGAPFNLGMIGFAESRKRLDLGLEILEKLRLTDHRYHLFIKGKMPWEYWWVWEKSEEREYFAKVFEHLNTSPDLGRSVVFDGFGPDVAAWLRKIGYVLSVSDDESFHLSPAEGMASGALPMILSWPGADDVFPSEWIHDSVDEIVEHILEIARNRSWTQHSIDCQQFVRSRYSVEEVCRQWEELIWDLVG
jgi:glycosyltransferase involved in cell wall biosynthesis